MANETNRPRCIQRVRFAASVAAGGVVSLLITCGTQATEEEEPIGIATQAIVAGKCADGTQEQTFTGGMVGCAGAVTFADRNALCAPGFRTVTAAEWVALRGSAAPTHDYWTNNDLKYSGSGTSACAVSAETGTSCGTTPMRVCTAGGSDAEGNHCNWQHCGLGSNAPDQFFGGCVGNTTSGAVCIVGGCADGTIEQTFAGGMVGCAASGTYANRASLCGPGYRVATAAEWVALRNGLAPTHDYWTDDALKWNGTGPSACFVSTSVGSTTCGTSPMRVCTAAGTDAEGNTCNWTHCGLNANTPDQFFGGCVSNAGALCVPNMGCADGSVEQVFAKGMVGCAGSVTFANRDTLCAPGYQPATAVQWAGNHGTVAPTHDYWTDDALKWSGTGPSACFVSTTVGSDTCGASPMRVCTPAGTDAEGNTCNWTHCGLNANTPDQFFGGCVSNAGTLCTPVQTTTVVSGTTLFKSHFPVTERHSAGGANTAGSFAAAAMMGAQGYSSISIPPSWESLITSSCTARTGGSPWPAACNSAGMGAALTAFSSSDWETYTWPDTDKTSALNEMVASLQFYQSPIAAPIYGQADHWVIVTEITATPNGGSWTINQVKGFDGGPSGAMDSSGNSYQTGLQSWSAFVWSNVFFQPVTIISSSCNPCTSDPSYNRHVLVFDPPRGQTHLPVSAVFAKAPGVAFAGQHAMDGQLARDGVWRALTSAGLDADPEIWNALRGGVPGAAFQVNARWPSGSPWDYYLVPIFESAKANRAVAFVQLAADDGSFEGINVLAHAIPFTPVSPGNAERRARGVLAPGERLTGGKLTWDSRSSTRIAKSPLRPYYEFGIVDLANPNKDVGVVRVTLHDGTASRSRHAHVRTASR